MRLILREQKNARTSALKVLSYAMNNLEGKESCQAFVEMLGLGVIFPLFMKPVKVSKKKKGNTYNNQEHLVSIIASLLKNCTGNTKQRVVLKFTENDYEKVDRLVLDFFSRDNIKINSVYQARGVQDRFFSFNIISQNKSSKYSTCKNHPVRCEVCNKCF